jgi:TolA-binding protein
MISSLTLPTIATIASSGAAIAAAAAVGLAPEALAVGIAFGGLNYTWLQYCQRAKMSSIKGLEKETSTLEDKIEQLSGQAKSIVSFAVINF